MVYTLINKKTIKKGRENKFFTMGGRGKGGMMRDYGRNGQTTTFTTTETIRLLWAAKKNLVTKLEFVKSLSDCIGHKTATIYSKQ